MSGIGAISCFAVSNRQDKLRVKLTRNSISPRVIWSNYTIVRRSLIIQPHIVTAATPNLPLIMICAGIISNFIVPLAFDRVFS